MEQVSHDWIRPTRLPYNAFKLGRPFHQYHPGMTHCVFYVFCQETHVFIVTARNFTFSLTFELDVCIIFFPLSFGSQHLCFDKAQLFIPLTTWCREGIPM